MILGQNHSPLGNLNTRTAPLKSDQWQIFNDKERNRRHILSLTRLAERPVKCSRRGHDTRPVMKPSVGMKTPFLQAFVYETYMHVLHSTPQL